MKNKIIALTVILSAFATSSCTMSTLRGSLGASKEMPDEFLVETRPNLVIPEKYDLPEPHEAGIPDFDKHNAEAQKLLTGSTGAGNVAISKGETSILQKANATTSSDDIKKTVYQEHKSTANKGVFGVEKGGFMEKVLDPFGYNAPKDPTLDIEAERKRVAKAIQEGKPVTGEAVLKDK